jgi:hypothetical protein
LSPCRGAKGARLNFSFFSRHEENIFLSLFSILAEIKARKIHLGFETREMKNNKKSMRLEKVSAAEKKLDPRCAVCNIARPVTTTLSIPEE